MMSVRSMMCCSMLVLAWVVGWSMLCSPIVCIFTFLISALMLMVFCIIRLVCVCLMVLVCRRVAFCSAC